MIVIQGFSYGCRQMAVGAGTVGIWDTGGFGSCLVILFPIISGLHYVVSEGASYNMAASNIYAARLLIWQQKSSKLSVPSNMPESALPFMI